MAPQSTQSNRPTSSREPHLRHLIVHPLLAAVQMRPMNRDTARAVLLLCALPSGFFGILFGLRYGFESHVAGSTLIASSLASAATVAVALVLTVGW